jgi:GNAT superfamily N-acetyltransferase
MTIRPMTRFDAKRVAALAGQLGYSAAAGRIAQRFDAIARDPDHGLFVAEESRGEIAGWIHVAVAPALIHDNLAEILSLVVDDAARGSGVGTMLVAAAEDWTRGRGLSRVRVRCRLEREHAHSFYETRGFHLTKTQHVFDKDLDPQRA